MLWLLITASVWCHNLYYFMVSLLGFIACTQCTDAAYCYRCMCLLLCTKMTEPVEMPFGGLDSGGPKKTCIRWGPRSPRAVLRVGRYLGPLWSIGNSWHESKLFGRWQQWCGLHCQYCSNFFNLTFLEITYLFCYWPSGSFYAVHRFE